MILPFRNHVPAIAADAFIADNATLIGDVVIGAKASVWFGCVLRGDTNFIRIGARTNLQDGTVVHVARDGWGTTVGDDVLIGHRAMIHACRIGDRALIGMMATVLDEAVVEDGAMVAAGAVITPGKIVGAGELWAGCPARFIRKLSDADQASMAAGTAHYVELAQEYRLSR